MSRRGLGIRSELMLRPLAGWLLMALLAPGAAAQTVPCLLYTSPSPRDVEEYRMPSSA